MIEILEDLGLVDDLWDLELVAYDTGTTAFIFQPEKK